MCWLSHKALCFTVTCSYLSITILGLTPTLHSFIPSLPGPPSSSCSLVLFHSPNISFYLPLMFCFLPPPPDSTYMRKKCLSSESWWSLLINITISNFQLHPFPRISSSFEKSEIVILTFEFSTPITQSQDVVGLRVWLGHLTVQTMAVLPLFLPLSPHC